MNQKLTKDLPSHSRRSDWTSEERAAVWFLEELRNEYDYGEREKDEYYNIVMSYFDKSGEFKAR